ncbi:ABC transporter substrate-binding protein [Halopiger aswanensis]|uniref:ABC-type Fe3+-hydroxamate transport system substrate-binding protein n=1 Tax=Halopiger aswanensis TaxID=148449 RepID=A0A3R7GVN0_9EURY|nr:ABC transporter substrate-binding protein [Halopiger aswanensis]RKD95060.1 ABC-type Fe3+-hydroxamate transport system substrate-binding protein [Halopiger aswanensis]
MPDESRRDSITRRRYMRYGGTVAAGGLLAGCTGPESEGNSSVDVETDDDSDYSVEISPVGEVTFEEVPTDVMSYSPQYADMLVALGHDESLNSIGFADYGETLSYFFDPLEGVDFDAEGLTELFSNGSFDKEVLYELDSDVHLMDPAWTSTFDGWSKDDTDEIRDNVGPWFANRYSRQHASPPEEWAADYQFYTIWELTEKVAQVFQEEERFAALQEVYDDMYGTIRANLPPANERPTVGLVTYYDDQFHPYRITGPGFGKAHVRPLEARDAFADSNKTYAENYEAAYDFEGMLEVDPDVILHNFAVTPFYDWGEITDTLEDHPLGQKLTAIQNDRFYASGQSFQGPIQTLLQLEMTAKQLYPDQFGEWPRYEPGDSYPDFDEDERLFDHERVEEIVAGEL